MKRILKITGIATVILLLGAVVFLWMKHEPLPKGQAGAEADALAHKMLNALHHEAYKKTRYLEWSYQGGRNHYVWDKRMGKVQVTMGNTSVDLNLNHLKKSIVYKDGKGVYEEDAISKALKNFNNDSFWLVAPYKIFDIGTKRSRIELENGDPALLVTYTSGGTTPGDSYLWLLKDNGFPYAFKMWVSIIPVGGLEASWDDWLVAESAAFLPKSHKLGPITLSMGTVEGTR